MIKWTLQERPLKSLKKHSKNPRQLSKDQYFHLRKSIEKFGLTEKPIINADNTIISGHQRIKILKELGYTSTECWIPERQLNEKDCEELCIRMNKNAGSFDYDILANEWEADDLLSWGFHEEELIGAFSEVVEEDSEEKQTKKKAGKKTECPSCGFEF